MNFSLDTHFQYAISRKTFLQKFARSRSRKWSRKVNHYIWGVKIPNLGEEDAEIKSLENRRLYVKSFEETKLKLPEETQPKILIDM
jgi:hypothetical protein